MRQKLKVMVSYLHNTKEHDFENDTILKCTYTGNSNKYDLIFLRTESKLVIVRRIFFRTYV